MKVVVFGAGGRLGRHVLAALADRHEITAVDLKVAPSAVGNWVAADIGDLDAVSKVVEGSDAVVNLAALVSGRADVSLDAFVRVMVHGTWNIVEAAARHGVSRVVNVSSVNAGGWPADGRERVFPDAKFALGAHDLFYSLSKRLGEEIVNSYTQTWPELAGVNIRPVVIVDGELEDAEQLPTPMHGSHGFVHVHGTDVAAAVAGALDTVPAPRGTYSVSAHRPDSLFDFEQAEQALGFEGRVRWEES